MKKINFELTTPERVLVRDEIDSVTLRTQEGELTILAGHIPLVAPLLTGEMIIRKGNEEIPLVVAGGFVEVQQGSRVVILADAAERVEEIDVERAREARERARQAMEGYRARDEVKFAEASAAFERALTRLRVARRRHAPHQTPYRETS